MSRNAARFFALVGVALVSAACSVQSPPAATERASNASYATAPQDRPGLGTKWGESRRSLSGNTAFTRADPTRPLVTAEIFYNDRSGIEAMAAASEFRRVWPVLSGPAASLISIGLKDQSGIFSPG